MYTEKLGSHRLLAF